MSVRTWISIITLGLIALVVFLARGELMRAWELFAQVDLWILSLSIPIIAISLFATGEMMFSYLRAKGSIVHLKPHQLIRLSLELNFVNHVVPSGGVSGLSYMGWRLTKLGVSPGRAAMAQLVRYAAQFGSFIGLLVLAVFIVTLDGNLNRWIILTSSGLVTTIAVAGLGLMYILSSRRRIAAFARWAAGVINKFVRKVTFGRKAHTISYIKLDKFFEDLHKDYKNIKREKHLLTKPLWWGVLANLADVALFFVAFWSLGQIANPAPILIAYGLASLSGIVVVTPGGAGAYEAIMVAFLGIAGISHGVALAGVLLARVILLVVTIGVGYIFYQQSIIKYGRIK